MKIKSILTITLAIIISNFSFAQEKTETTQQIFAKSLEQAKQENKNVFIIFRASWCSNCKKMDASMNAPSTKKLFNENYVIKHLVVLESKNKKHLENAGSEDFLKKYGGDRQGVPFWLIFDSNGNLLADSKMVKNGFVLKEKGGNIGCPASDDEVAAFIYKLKETSNLSDKELAIIAKQFKLNNSTRK